ncbi:hypothetical protein M413DRAFT_20740 [Hebeloma cylindrosporum]|uniref:DUF6830 domain-containing protein n=1 Tax=Hebeloma cylindrosporum TaxID=76867 RepID=A0A0C3BG04_HEBCY|nr:hypothetical protein M413DRAFT_20740 [Hebeloma cylindrosporum h7]
MEPQKDVPDLSSHHANADAEDVEIPVDPRGDLFGDYDSYLLEENQMDVSDEESKEDNTSSPNGGDSDDDDDDEFDAVVAEQENGLEPDRLQASVPCLTTSTGGMDEESSSSPALRLRGGAESALKKEPFKVKFTKGRAGEVYSQDGVNNNTHYAKAVGNSNNPYAPFSSKLEWELAYWDKMRGPSSTAFTELMKIEGVHERLGVSYKNSAELNKMIDESLPGRPRFVRHEVIVGNEVCEVYFRDIIACIRALFGDPDFAPYLVFLPEKHYTDEMKTVRMYHDMHTGKWWWSTQEQLEKDKPGATIIPIIISTDKTQSTLFRNKSAYPLYMTIGNIPKEIRRKPSSRAYVLLAYLPTTRLEAETNQAARRRLLGNLYHACMSKILEPLREAGQSGILMTSGDGSVRRNHPILAAFIGDYPEQVLTTCTKTGECPTCPISRNELGEYDPNDATPWLRDLDSILEALDSFDDNPGGFLQTCADVGIKPVFNPFWKELPYAHIYRSITPDILHQLYQGVIKHTIGWVKAALGAAELDARCRRMPPNHNVRLFLKGITSLSRHYVDFIKLYGTLDNFNTEYTERLHIDLAKDAYRATNHKDEFTQMTLWLERKEKMFRHHQFVQWRLNGSPKPPKLKWTPPGLELDRKLHMAKRPSAKSVHLNTLINKYGAKHFREALARFVILSNDPNVTRSQLERRLWGVRIPFNKLPVWHRIKYQRTDPYTARCSTADSIHCQPERVSKRGAGIPGRFDTALINDGTGEEIGIEGYRVGRIRVVFSLPPASLSVLFNAQVTVPEHLVYVQWFSRFAVRGPDRNHQLYKISPLKEPDGTHVCSIIPLANVHRSVHLFPRFGRFAPAEWTSSNVLDLCDTFFVNTFTDRQLYRVIC